MTNYETGLNYDLNSNIRLAVKNYEASTIIYGQGNFFVRLFDFERC